MTNKPDPRYRFSGIFALLISCSAEPSTSDATPSATKDDEVQGTFPDTLRGACPLDRRNGSFDITVLKDYSSLGGNVASGVVPGNIPSVVMEKEGCRLLHKSNPFCDPPCQGQQTCDLNGECIPYPENQDAGTVKIAGLQAQVTMSPIEPGMNYFQPISTDSHPVFLEGAKISLTSTDGYAGKMALFGVGVAALEVLDEIWTFSEGEPLAVNWTPANDPTYSRVLFDVSVDQHGSSPYRLYCDMDDTGSALVPAELIYALLQAGVSGFPNGHLTRRTVDSTQDAASCIELTISTPIGVAVDVLGSTPCNKDSDCPTGQICDLVTHLCR
ncbi:MAG: hypothetical protein V3V08_09150 [Nannocystaceae bacterium]